MNTAAWSSKIDLQTSPAWRECNRCDHDQQPWSSCGTAPVGQNIALSSTLANSWNQQTIASANTGSYHLAYQFNPNGTGYTTMQFYKNTANNTAAVDIGSFSFDNTGTLTFDAVSVPEPSMYGMFAAAGVLLVGLRNQFRRKQA